MERIAKVIIKRREYTEIIRGYKHYGLLFADSIGYRISPDDGSRIFLFYGEVKIDAKNQYHVIPRTRRSQK